jgi:PAS domain S-box-containing protein
VIRACSWRRRLPPALLFALLVVAGAGAALIAQRLSVRLRHGSQPRAHDQLAASERRFAAILSIAAEAIITVDHSQRVLHFNRGAEEIFGYSEADILGRHLSVLIPQRFRDAHSLHVPAFARSAATARRMGERQEIFGLRADGSEFPAEASISKLVGSDGILFTVVLRDTTRQHRAVAEQRFLADASSALSRTLAVDETVRTIVDLPVPLLADASLAVIRGPHGSLQRVASARHAGDVSSGLAAVIAEPLTEDSPWPSIDVMRRNRRLLVEDVSDEWLERYAEGAELAAWRAVGARSLLILPIHASGETLGALTLVRTRADPFDDDARRLAATFSATAATALANARLYESARAANRARDEMLSVVSHDLRNPLTAIGMCVHALEFDHDSNPDERRELLSTIRASSGLMNRMIEDLLDVASIERGQLSISLAPQEPSELARRAVQLFEVEADESGVQLRARFDTNLPLIQADVGRIVQVLGNLIRNAITFTPRGGSIEVGVHASGTEVVFAVADTGRGISTEHLPHVFDRYWHSDESMRVRGHGLGLSIAWGIIRAHDGRIWATSDPGRGSTFQFAISAAGASSDVAG